LTFRKCYHRIQNVSSSEKKQRHRRLDICRQRFRRPNHAERLPSHWNTGRSSLGRCLWRNLPPSNCLRSYKYFVQCTRCSAKYAHIKKIPSTNKQVRCEMWWLPWYVGKQWLDYLAGSVTLVSMVLSLLPRSLLLQRRKTNFTLVEIRRTKRALSLQPQLCNKILAAGTAPDDKLMSPLIRQTLLHWGLEITANILEQHRKGVGR
jgi:hypothetical protein